MDATLPLLADREALDYLDVQTVTLARPVTPLEAWNLIMADPLPGLSLAFRVRDAVSARFGVDRIEGFSGRRRDDVAVGDRLDFFTVEDAAPGRLVLAVRDSHLDVMVSVLTERARLTLAASVVTHNTFGRAYMLPVGPAHRVIVAAMLRRLKRRIAKGEMAE